LIIVDVIVGTVCLIAIRRSVSGRTDCRRWDEGSCQLSHIYDNLFVPKLSGERRLDRSFRRRLQSKPKCQQ